MTEKVRKMLNMIHQMPDLELEANRFRWENMSVYGDARTRKRASALFHACLDEQIKRSYSGL